MTTGSNSNEATCSAQWQPQLTFTYRLVNQQIDSNEAWSFGHLMKQAWDVTQKKSFVGQRRSYPSFPSRSFLSFSDNKQVWIRIILQVEQSQIVTWIGKNYSGEEDKRSTLGLIDISISPRKEMHLPDYNHFGKLHFNAESSAQQWGGPCPFER